MLISDRKYADIYYFISSQNTGVAGLCILTKLLGLTTFYCVSKSRKLIKAMVADKPLSSACRRYNSYSVPLAVS